MLKIIAAVGKNLELGYKNDLIWRFKEDLQLFKSATQGAYIFMGENTYFSLPKRLANRKYLVLSPTMQGEDGIKVFRSIPEFLEFAQNQSEDIFVIGGASVYRQMLPYAKQLILTEIDAEFKEADVYFPAFDKQKCGKIIKINENLQENGTTYSRTIYEF